jgi:ketosteroid isomerase-like protein
MTYLEKAEDLYAMMETVQVMEAFEKYYHLDVTVIEPTGETRQGKDAQRKAIEEWMAGVDEMHGGDTPWVTSNEEAGVTMVRSSTEVTMQGHRMVMSEVAVQQWEGDQIIREEFFYFVPAEEQKRMAVA